MDNRATNRWLWNPHLIFVYNSQRIESFIMWNKCNLGFAKSDNMANKRRPFVVMGCQRGETHRAYINKNRLVAEVARLEDMGKNNAMYGCISKTTIGLPCAVNC
jgi:hypothetical protein